MGPMNNTMNDTIRERTETRALYRCAVVVLFTVLAFPASAPAVLVDHIAAAVNNEVITSSELAQTVALNERFGRSATNTDRAALMSETLEGLITRRLLVQEARRLRFVDITDEEVNAEVDKIRTRFPSSAAFTDFLKSLDMTEQELRRMLGEQLLVERFVGKKVGLFVRVGRDEAQNYFDTHGAQFQGKRFQDVQKAIIAELTDQKIGKQLDQYVAELRGKAEIRINPS